MKNRIQKEKTETPTDRIMAWIAMLKCKFDTLEAVMFMFYTKKALEKRLTGLPIRVPYVRLKITWLHGKF